MLTVIYDKDSDSTPDHLAAQTAENAIKAYLEKPGVDQEFSTSSFIMVEAFRVMVVRGKLKHTELEFEFEDQTITVDERVQLSSWPKGFCDIFDNFLSELLGWSTK